MAPFDWGGPVGVPALAAVTIGDLPAEATVALEAAGARVTAAIGWDAIAEAVDADGLIVAAVPADVGHGALEALADLIAARATDAVVAFEAEALDAVAAALLGSRAELLCDADAGEWAAALVLAAHRSGVETGAGPAGVREGGEADRLRRLHEEVARIASQLAALAALAAEAEPADAIADRRRSYGAGPGGAVAVDAAEIRRVIRARRLRAQFFDARLLEDPGWDMLLDLFAAELEGMRVSVSSLCIAAAVAPTTALRWISRMADAGLMVRVADPGDRRRAFVALSAQAGDAMRAYVGAARRAGVSIA